MFAKTVGCLDDIQKLKSFSGCIPWLVDEVHVCLAVRMKLDVSSRQVEAFHQQFEQFAPDWDFWSENQCFRGSLAYDCESPVTVTMVKTAQLSESWLPENVYVRG